MSSLSTFSAGLLDLISSFSFSVLLHVFCLITSDAASPSWYFVSAASIIALSHLNAYEVVSGVSDLFSDFSVVFLDRFPFLISIFSKPSSSITGFSLVLFSSSQNIIVSECCSDIVLVFSSDSTFCIWTALYAISDHFFLISFFLNSFSAWFWSLISSLSSWLGLSSEYTGCRVFSLLEIFLIGLWTPTQSSISRDVWRWKLTTDGWIGLTALSISVAPNILESVHFDSSTLIIISDVTLALKFGSSWLILEAVMKESLLSKVQDLWRTFSYATFLSTHVAWELSKPSKAWPSSTSWGNISPDCSSIFSSLHDDIFLVETSISSVACWTWAFSCEASVTDSYLSSWIWITSGCWRYKAFSESVRSWSMSSSLLSKEELVLPTSIATELVSLCNLISGAFIWFIRLSFASGLGRELLLELVWLLFDDVLFLFFFTLFLILQ